MSKKDRKIILIAQFLVNPYCRVHILGQNFPLSHELMNYSISLSRDHGHGFEAKSTGTAAI